MNTWKLIVISCQVPKVPHLEKEDTDTENLALTETGIEIGTGTGTETEIGTGTGIETEIGTEKKIEIGTEKKIEIGTGIEEIGIEKGTEIETGTEITIGTGKGIGEIGLMIEERKEEKEKGRGVEVPVQLIECPEKEVKVLFHAKKETTKDKEWMEKIIDKTNLISFFMCIKTTTATMKTMAIPATTACNFTHQILIIGNKMAITR